MKLLNSQLVNMKKIVILFFISNICFYSNAEVSNKERLEKYKQAAVFLNDVYKIRSISKDKIENTKDVENLKIVTDTLNGFVQKINDWDKINDSKKLSEAILKIADKGDRKRDNAIAYNDLKENLTIIDNQIASKDSDEGNSDEVIKSDNQTANNANVVPNETTVKANKFKYIVIALLLLLSVISAYLFLQFKKTTTHINKINNNIIQLKEFVNKMESKPIIKNGESKQVNVEPLKEPIVEVKKEIVKDEPKIEQQIVEPIKPIIKYAKKSSNSGFENRDLRTVQNGECIFELHILDNIAKLKISSEPQVQRYVLKSENPGYYFTNDICEIKGTPNADLSIKIEEEGELQFILDGAKWEILNSKKLKIAFQ